MDKGGGTGNPLARACRGLAGKRRHTEGVL